MTKDTRASRQKLLSQMRLKVANIEEAVSAVETLVARFEIERRKRTRLVVGPGMVAYDVLKQVESAHQSLRKEGLNCKSSPSALSSVIQGVEQ